MNYYEQLNAIIGEVEDDFGKFYDKSNKAAGTRVRKAMQSLKNLAQEIRTDVQNRKNED
ncbi:MAG: histone H1 [Bacteroidota bacterium]